MMPSLSVKSDLVFPYPLLLAEAIASLFVAATALLALTGYVVDLLGWPLDPILLAVLLLVELALIVGGAVYALRRGRLTLSASGLLGFVVVVVGMLAYLLWLSRPDFFPITVSGDTVHHLWLIDFIQDKHSLAHDQGLTRWLGGMVIYSPGSHILAALLGDWLSRPGVYVMHPLLAALIAVKLGIVYTIMWRLLPRVGPRQAIAVAACALILVPYHFIESFTFSHFYPQVVSETFAIAMLWALLVWDTRPARWLLGFFALSGIGVWLAWPVWLSVPSLALGALILLRQDMGLRAKAKALAYAFAPIAVFVALYSAGRVGAVSILQAEGAILRPSLATLGWPFLLLVVIGIAVSLRRRAVLPLHLFTAAGALQLLAFFAFDRYHQVESYYQTIKMLYLLLYPMLVYAALAFDALWQLPTRWLSPPWRARWRAASVVLPVLVLVGVAYRTPPAHASAMAEPTYQAGRWARANLPHGCIGYIAGDWVTAYWLHTGVIGNPIDQASTNDIVQNRWREAGKQAPFIITDDLAAVPPEVRATTSVLVEAPPAAVLQRTNAPLCTDNPPTLDDQPLLPRSGTVAAALGSLLSR